MKLKEESSSLNEKMAAGFHTYLHRNDFDHHLIPIARIQQVCPVRMRYVLRGSPGALETPQGAIASVRTELWLLLTRGDSKKKKNHHHCSWTVSV